MDKNFEALAVIHDLLHCKQCKGKGWIYNPKGRDKRCACRLRAKEFLRENE